jgi:FKBP-type peptidyl-prolyl cis-trans isomerase
MIRLMTVTCFALAVSLAPGFAAEGDGQTLDLPGGGTGEFDTIEEKVSYGVGAQLGMQMKQQGADLDPDIIARGFKDVMEGKDLAVTQQEMMQAMQQYQQSMMQRAGEENLAEGKRFLAENKKREGVKTTDSGLQYKVIEEGDGKSPEIGDVVEVHYTGKRLDDTVFDSSRQDGGEPVKFPMTEGVIKGWVEGLQLMDVGAKYRLWLPAELAYGERGNPRGQIAPNSVLKFDVELLGVEKGAAPKKQGQIEMPTE